MKIVITKEEVKTKSFAEFEAGELMTLVGGRAIHIKTSDAYLVNLSTGYSDSSISPIELYIDVTDKFILTNITA